MGTVERESTASNKYKFVCLRLCDEVFLFIS